MAEGIPFNWPYLTGREQKYVTEAASGGRLAGDGPFTKLCHGWLKECTGTAQGLLTHSCTAALEIASLLLDLAPGDEVIMPSFNFVSGANAVALRGGVPVFVDIRPDTLNIDENCIAAAITSRTRAILVVHYAGVGCAMDEIMELASQHGIVVIEDAAHGIIASYKGLALGSIGHLGAFSFHETKNVICGEGGALLVNDKRMIPRAEIIREKGTDRSRFFRGEVDKYTWQDIGSSYLAGELVAAFLWAQLNEGKEITRRRSEHWQRYHEMLLGLECEGVIRRPIIPPECEHNAHLYYVLLADGIDRGRVLECFRERNIGAMFHYVPLHSSPAGRRLGRVHGDLAVTEKAAGQLIRLPLWIGMTAAQQERVVETLHWALCL